MDFSFTTGALSFFFSFPFPLFLILKNKTLFPKAAAAYASALEEARAFYEGLIAALLEAHGPVFPPSKKKKKNRESLFSWLPQRARDAGRALAEASAAAAAAQAGAAPTAASAARDPTGAAAALGQCLVALGDVSRYQAQVVAASSSSSVPEGKGGAEGREKEKKKESPSSSLLDTAERRYSLASLVHPGLGKAYNQLGVLSGAKRRLQRGEGRGGGGDEALAEAFFYCRGTALVAVESSSSFDDDGDGDNNDPLSSLHAEPFGPNNLRLSLSGFRESLLAERRQRREKEREKEGEKEQGEERQKEKEKDKKKSQESSKWPLQVR